MLVQEFTNGSVHESWNMVRRIESGDLVLPPTHSEPAHSLAAKLAPAPKP